jgi:ADP-dependent phosphofructokinase/glucokinase
MKKQAKKSQAEEEEYTLWEGLESIKDVGSDARTVKQLIKALESEIKYLKEIQAAGMHIEIDDGMLILKTESEKVAKKYGFHKQKVVGGQVEDVLVGGHPVYA